MQAESSQTKKFACTCTISINILGNKHKLHIVQHEFKTNLGGLQYLLCIQLNIYFKLATL